MKARDTMPTVDKSAAADAIKAASAAKCPAYTDEVAMRVTDHRARATYANAAAIVANEAGQLHRRADQLTTFEMASSLASFAVVMPRPRSRDDVLAKALGRAPKRKIPKPGLVLILLRHNRFCGVEPDYGYKRPTYN